MKGILIDTVSIDFVDFIKAEDIFFTNKFTIVGACPEESLIVVALKDKQDDENEHCLLSSESLSILNYDQPPRGKLLVIKNDEHGCLIDVTEQDIKRFALN